MLEMMEMAPLDIINEHFENDKIKAMLLYMTCMWGLTRARAAWAGTSL